MEREEELKKIKAADEAYYGRFGNLLMSDAEYDALRRDYLAKYGSGDLDYVPGADLGGKKFQHPSPAKSLGKIDESEQGKLLQYIEQFRPLVIEPKLDGCSIVVYPVQGKPMYVTRGGGNEGDILTRFPSPERSAPYTAEYPIRGEVYMDFQSFDKMNEALESAGESPMANPRNSVNPILTGDAHPEFVRFLSFQAYDVMGVDWSETEKIRYIEDHTPFLVPPMRKYDEESASEIAATIPSLYQEFEKNLGYPIDGLVLKCDWPGSLEKFGTTDHHDKNAIAWKPAQVPEKTVITGVHWQLGKTGQLTPVADLEPVEILGSTVSNASLHNINIVQRLGGLAIGDEVGVIKAKLIIPQIVIVYARHGGTPIEEPQVCPFCGSAVIHRRSPAAAADDGDILCCPNLKDHERIAQQIAFLADRSVLNIDQLSIGNARLLVQAFPEAAEENGAYFIFRLSQEEIKKALILPADQRKTGRQPKEEPVSPAKLEEALRRCRRQVALPRFIKALCIENLGESIGTLLSKRFGTLDQLLAAAPEEIEKIPGIGPVTLQVLSSPEFRGRVKELRQYIEPLDYEAADVPASSVYRGKSFVLTGKMPHPRKYYVSQIEKAGGTVVSAVSRQTDFLVIADPSSNSTKAQQARKFGTKLLSPEELEDTLQDIANHA